MIRKFTVRKTFFAALVMAATASLVLAQGPGFGGPRPGPGGPGMGAAGIGPKIAQQLGLSDAQKSQIQNYLKDSRSQLEVLRNDTTLTPDQRRTQAQQIRQTTKDKVQSVLTPDQQTQLAQLRTQAQQKAQARREQFVDQRLARMTSRLGLNANQSAAIKSLTDTARTQAQAIRENTALSQDQKIQQLQDLRKSTRDQVVAQLTPEQKTQLDQMIQNAQQRFKQGGPRRGGRRGPRGGAPGMGPGDMAPGPMGMSL
jgi:Spy/CpxP family protein refolding chaperone